MSSSPAIFTYLNVFLFNAHKCYSQFLFNDCLFVNQQLLAVIIKYVQSVGAIMMNMTLSQAPMGSYQMEEIQIYRENFNARYLKDGLLR